MITPHCESAYKSKQPLLMYLLTQVHIRSRLLNRLLALPIGDIVIMPRSRHLNIVVKEAPSGNLCPLLCNYTTFQKECKACGGLLHDFVMPSPAQYASFANGARTGSRRKQQKCAHCPVTLCASALGPSTHQPPDVCALYCTNRQIYRPK